ncbi:MAG: hypothetical protein AAF218_01510 [Pseudomonadota bacterium]
MEWIVGLILAFVLAGVILAVRERRTGRGTLIDETVGTPQTEADRERIRAEGVALNRMSGNDGHIF